MKKVILISLLVLGAFAVNAKESPAAAAKSIVVSLRPLASSSNAVLTVRNIQETSASLAILNEDGTTIYAKSLYKPFVRELFNFSKLEEGEYTLEIVNGNQLARKSFSISESGDVSVTENTELEALTPSVQLVEEKVAVIFENESAEDVSVNIFDANNKLIYEELGSQVKKFGKLYKLEGLSEGVYRMEIKAGKKQFEKELKL